MTEQARFRLDRISGVPVVYASGEVDLKNVGALEECIQGAADSDRGSVLVALDQLSYFDSKTIEVLVRLSRRIAANRQKLLLVAARDSPARRLLTTSGVATILAISESVEAALAKLRAPHT